MTTVPTIVVFRRREGGVGRARACGRRAHLADPRRGGREPEPRRGQRRAAGHRQGVRRGPDRAQPRRGRLLARAGRVRALPRRARRPLRAQADAAARHGAGDPGVAAGGLRAVDRGAVRGAPPRRPGGGDGLPDHARADHRAVVGPGAHAVDRAVVGPRRSDRRARPVARRARCSPSSTGGRSSWSRCRSRWWPSTWPSASCPPTSTRRRDPVDNLGGILSVLLVAALVLAINFAPVPNEGALAMGLAVIALAAGVAFVHPPASGEDRRSTT